MEWLIYIIRGFNFLIIILYTIVLEEHYPVYLYNYSLQFSILFLTLTEENKSLLEPTTPIVEFLDDTDQHTYGMGYSRVAWQKRGHVAFPVPVP